MLSSRNVRRAASRRVPELVRREVHHTLLGGGITAELALNAPFSHHEDAVGEREHFRQVARDDEARPAPSAAWRRIIS